MHAEPPRSGQTFGIILILGAISFFTAWSSAMVYSVLPLFLVKELNAGVAYVGLIEGVGESLNSFAKVASGALSDSIRRRKFFVSLGYGLSALNKLVFPLAAEPLTVLLARVIDRFGKGVRDAPRDALVADVIPTAHRGAGYGLRLTFYTAGYVIGPLTAMAVMTSSNNNFRLIFWIAVIPAVIGFIIAVTQLKEPPPPTAPKDRLPISFARISELPRAFWYVLFAASFFAFARIGNGLLVLRAHEIGMTPSQIPIILLIIHLVYACFAYPMGILSDHIDRSLQLKLGAIILILSALVIAHISTTPLMLLGSGLWGLQLAVTQGLFAALIADNAPSELRGTAFGLHELFTGLATLSANILAGGLWAFSGSQMTFTASAIIATTALIFVVAISPKITRSSSA